MTQIRIDNNIPKTGWRGIKENWKSDILAALSVSMVALPLALGVAVASGVEPIAGLISAIIGGIVVTLYRGSHLAINGPAAGLIAVMLSALMSLDDGTGQAFNYVLAATVVAGGIQVILGVFKLGYIAESIPSSVINGVMVAIGVIIFTSQIYVAFGIPPIQGNTVEKLTGFFDHIDKVNPFILSISLISIVLLVVIPKIQSRLLHFLPASLWVLFVSIPLVYFFNFMEPHTSHIFGHDYTVGPKFLISIPDDLSKAILHPNFSKADTFEFWVAVISITLIASMQTLAMAKAVDRLDPYKRVTNLNKDLIGVGIGTMVCGAIGGLPIITVVVRSTVNITNHAKTKWSNFYHGIFLILFLLVLSPVIQLIPYAALAAILVYIGFRLASPTTFKKIYGEGIEQLIFMVVTLIITLYTNLLWGIIGGTLFTLLVQVLLARLPITTFLSLSLNSDSSLFIRKDGNYDMSIKGVANFMSIPKFSKLTRDIPIGKDITVDLSQTRLVDLTFLEKIYEFGDQYRESGGNLNIKGMEQHVSSSTHSKALKISLVPMGQKLSPRQERLKDIALQNDYLYESRTNNETLHLKEFQFFDIRPIERQSNCLTGELEDRNIKWEIADVVFNEGASFTAEVFYTTLMTIKLNTAIPKFIMEKEGLFEKLFDRVLAFTGYKDIDFPEHPKFSEEVLLYAENDDDVRSFFTDKLIEFFEGEQIYHIESNGNSLLIFSKVKLARTDETQKLLSFGLDLVDRIGQ